MTGGELVEAGLGRLTLLDLVADLGDVAEATTAGVGVEAELHRNVGVVQQAELPGGCVVAHTLIMTRGCHRVGVNSGRTTPVTVNR